MNQLRPLTVGEILDGALRVYREAIVTLLGVAAVTVGIPTLLVLILFSNAQSAEGVVVAGLAVGLLYLIGGLIATAATVWVVAETYLGNPASLPGALAFAIGRIGRLFVAGLAKWLVVAAAEVGVGFLMAAAVFMFGGNTAAAVVAGVVLIGAMLAVAVFLLAGYSVVTQTVVLEPVVNATDALPRSWSLTSGYRGRAVLLWFTAMVLILVPALVVGAMGQMLPVLRFVTDVVGTLVQLLLYPVFGCVFTLFYYDLRVRKEAFDLEALEQQIDTDQGVR